MTFNISETALDGHRIRKVVEQCPPHLQLPDIVPRAFVVKLLDYRVMA